MPSATDSWISANEFVYELAVTVAEALFHPNAAAACSSACVVAAVVPDGTLLDPLTAVDVDVRSSGVAVFPESSRMNNCTASELAGVTVTVEDSLAPAILYHWYRPTNDSDDHASVHPLEVIVSVVSAFAQQRRRFPLVGGEANVAL